MKKIIITLLVVGSLVTPTISLIKSIQFMQNCSGYLKQAADANSVELAVERLNKAIDYIEAHNLTEGYTSILWKTEDENIGFWYQNLKVCQAELSDAADATQLEKTNVLMKVRESLTDDGGDDGITLTMPAGISRYPHNARYAILNWLSFIFLVLFLSVCLYLSTDL